MAEPYDWENDPELAQLVDDRERARDLAVSMLDRLHHAEECCKLLDEWIHGGRSDGHLWAKVVLSVMKWKLSQ